MAMYLGYGQNEPVLYAYVWIDGKLERVSWSHRTMLRSGLLRRHERRRLARANSGRGRRNARRQPSIGNVQYVGHATKAAGMNCMLYLRHGETPNWRHCEKLDREVGRESMKDAIKWAPHARSR